VTDHLQPSWTNEQVTALARARSAKRYLESMVDRIQASGSLLDPEPLADLGRFVNQVAYPAALSYARLLHSRYSTPSSPLLRGGGK
jgi:hypothetical protein